MLRIVSAFANEMNCDQNFKLKEHGTTFKGKAFLHTCFILTCYDFDIIISMYV